MDSTRRLRVVGLDARESRAEPTPAVSDEPDDLTREEYWTRVRDLRDDLHRLRPAN